jgi:hypothetical protein
VRRRAGPPPRPRPPPSPLPPPTSGRRGQGQPLPARRGAAGAAGWLVRAAAALRRGVGPGVGRRHGPPSDLSQVVCYVSDLLLPIFHHLHSQQIDLECLFQIAEKRRKKSKYEMNLKVINPYIRKHYSVCTDLLFRMYGNIIPYVRIYYSVCTESLFRTYGNIVSVCTETLFRTNGNISSGGEAASLDPGRSRAPCSMPAWPVSIELIDLPFCHSSHVAVEQVAHQAPSPRTRQQTARPARCRLGSHSESPRAPVHPPLARGGGRTGCAGFIHSGRNAAGRRRPAARGPAWLPAGRITAWRRLQGRGRGVGRALPGRRPTRKTTRKTTRMPRRRGGAPPPRGPPSAARAGSRRRPTPRRVRRVRAGRGGGPGR